jgi:hypothetical protein
MGSRFTATLAAAAAILVAAGACAPAPAPSTARPLVPPIDPAFEAERVADCNRIARLEEQMSARLARDGVAYRATPARQCVGRTTEGEAVKAAAALRAIEAERLQKMVDGIKVDADCWRLRGDVADVNHRLRKAGMTPLRSPRC